MPLETATYINQLVISNPANSDGLNQADDHMRLLKATIKATFPNFTAAPLNSTQAQIDAITANGAATLADAGVFYKTNSTDGFTNPAAGEIDVKLQGNVAAQFVRSAGVNTFTFNGSLVAPGAVPIGTPLMWLTDTLPAAGFGTWAWANGQAISRTTYAALFAQIGTTYGIGDGSTTFNLPNWQEVTLVGKSTMGGASSPGLLTSISGALKTALGKLFGADTVTLSAANLPPHNHAVFLKDPGHTHTTNAAIATGGAQAVGGVNFAQAGATINSATTGMTIGSVNGVANDNQTAAGPGTSTAVNNLPPMSTVNFIIRIA